jgi:septum formation protein
MKLTEYKVVLASNSPRRRELMKGIDLDFEVHTLPNIDESYPNELNHDEVAEYIAKEKAEAYVNMLKDDEMLITADTVVLLDDYILGKPKDRDEAQGMLRKLSGRTHKVVTGVCLTTKNKQVSFSDTALVTFSTIDDEEIEYYLDNYHYSDKAGSYGVQDWIGYVAVERIEGSYFNVMGLPIHKVYQAIKRF